MIDLTPKEIATLVRLVNTDVVKDEIGAANWDLTRAEEETLWGIIAKTEGV